MAQAFFVDSLGEHHCFLLGKSYFMLQPSWDLWNFEGKLLGELHPTLELIVQHLTNYDEAECSPEEAPGMDSFNAAELREALQTWQRLLDASDREPGARLRFKQGR